MEAVANYLALSNVGLGSCGYSAKTIVELAESDFARLQIALKGNPTTVLRAGDIAIDQQRPCIVLPGQPISVAFEPGYEQLILGISGAAPEEALATLLGAKPSGALIFDPLAPAKQPSIQV